MNYKLTSLRDKSKSHLIKDKNNIDEVVDSINKYNETGRASVVNDHLILYEGMGAYITMWRVDIIEN